MTRQSDTLRAAEFASLQPPDTSAADELYDRAQERIALMQPREVAPYATTFCESCKELTVKTTDGKFVRIVPANVFGEWLQERVENEIRKEREDYV